MNREDIIRMALEASGHDFVGKRTIEFAERFAVLVAADKDKEIERLYADSERFNWCISVLHRQGEKDSYFVIDTGCGCCGDGRKFDFSISGRDAIDVARSKP